MLAVTELVVTYSEGVGMLGGDFDDALCDERRRHQSAGIALAGSEVVSVDVERRMFHFTCLF